MNVDDSLEFINNFMNSFVAIRTLIRGYGNIESQADSRRTWSTVFTIKKKMQYRINTLARLLSLPAIVNRCQGIRDQFP